MNELSLSPPVAAPQRLRIMPEQHKIPVLFCARLDAGVEEIRRYLAGAFSWLFFGQAKKSERTCHQVVLP